MRYRPSPAPISTSAVEHGRSTVPRPPRGEAIAGELADGFPVWIVDHDDGSTSVISAVAPPAPKTQTYVRDDVSSQVGRAIVAWIPGVRKFIAGGILFDESGRALGYADYDACLDSCPKIDDMPRVLHDLDSFAIEAGADAIEVGKLVEGQARTRASTWLPWRRPAAREVDMKSADTPPLSRRSLQDVSKLAEGRYAIVDGDTVRSTHEPPAICKQAKQCGSCGADRLPLGGITSSDAAHIHRDGWWRDPADYNRSKHAVYVESQPGTFVVQRQGASFRIVAGIFRGVCSGSW